MGSPFYDKRSDMRSRISSIKDGRTTRALKVQQCTSAIADVSRHIAYGLGCNEDRQKMAHLYEQLGREIEEVWRCEDLIAQLDRPTRKGAERPASGLNVYGFFNLPNRIFTLFDLGDLTLNRRVDLLKKHQISCNG